MLRLPVTATASCCGCLRRQMRGATVPCYGPYAVQRLSAKDITLCYVCLLRPLIRATIACYGYDHYVVIRLPATATTSCCAMVACYGFYIVLRPLCRATVACNGQYAVLWLLLWPLRCEKVACCGHFAVLWLPAMATTM